jgi:hypothetical protein
LYKHGRFSQLCRIANYRNNPNFSAKQKKICTELVEVLSVKPVSSVFQFFTSKMCPHDRINRDSYIIHHQISLQSRKKSVLSLSKYYPSNPRLNEFIRAGVSSVCQFFTSKMCPHDRINRDSYIIHHQISLQSRKNLY